MKIEGDHESNLDSQELKIFLLSKKNTGRQKLFNLPTDIC